MRNLFKLLYLALALVTSSTAFAQVVSINARNEPYSSFPAIRNVTSSTTPVDLRIAALTAAAGAYRAQAPFDERLPAGSRFRMIYSDGSSEIGEVETVSSSLGSVPVPGTQRDASGNLLSGSSGGGVGDGNGGPAGTGGGGYAGGGGWRGGWACVTAGDTVQCFFQYY